MILKLCVLNVMFSILFYIGIIIYFSLNTQHEPKDLIYLIPILIIAIRCIYRLFHDSVYMECKNLLYDKDIYEGGLFASPVKASSWFDYLFGQNWYSRLGIGITGFILFFVLYIYG